MQNRKGMTLVELIVVVVVITFITSLLILANLMANGHKANRTTAPTPGICLNRDSNGGYFDASPAGMARIIVPQLRANRKQKDGFLGRGLGPELAGDAKTEARHAQWAQQQAANYAKNRDSYNRAYSACLEGKGYTVK